MKLPRKLRKKLNREFPYIAKKTIGNRPAHEGYYFWEFRNAFKRVINSTVFLDCPSREQLIAWWQENYPDSVEAKVVVHQNFLKHSIDMRENLIKNYKAHGKVKELETILWHGLQDTAA